MELLHQKYIDKIEDCPLNNHTGDIKLFRWVKKEDLSNSFTPFGFQAKFQNSCIAWGLSTFNSEKSAKESLSNLSLSRRKKYDSIAFCVIKNENGIKHQSGNSKNHFTFYPNTEFNASSNFQIIENED